MAEVLDIFRWVFNKLRSDATITSLVGDRIYNGIGPLNARMPCIVISSMAPSDYMTFNANRVLVNDVLLVKAIGEGTSYEAIEPIVDRIDALLHAESGPVVGQTTYVESCVGQEPVMYPELDESSNKSYRHLGRTYAISLSNN